MVGKIGIYLYIIPKKSALMDQISHLQFDKEMLFTLYTQGYILLYIEKECHKSS